MPGGEEYGAIVFVAVVVLITFGVWLRRLWLRDAEVIKGSGPLVDQMRVESRQQINRELDDQIMRTIALTHQELTGPELAALAEVHSIWAAKDREAAR